MYINQVFELSMVLDNERFQKILNRVCRKNRYIEENEDGYIDESLSSKGITVAYRDSQYKKKIKLIVEPRSVLDSKVLDPDRFIRKLDKRINEYFDFKYRLDDFVLSGVTFATDIDVHTHENVFSYLKVLQRIGRVKGYSPENYDCFEDVDSFCLEGNSNDIAFWLYDLEGFLVDQFHNEDIGRKKLKSMRSEVEGILRAEVRLTKPKAIRSYTNTDDVFDQITELTEKRQEIFLDVFTRIIPFGDYYKKGEAAELIRSEVKDCTLRRKMLRLVTLIPEKKSLYLAQKAMNCRNIEKVMEAFAKINLSPVTISKRHDVQYLKNLYSYLLEES
ncbi:MAG: hypothetical protein K2G55_20370 [Lachnospiraceae bacterium]|nr:hypothetical protein [Lachnospiraceae bacterium]MDE7202623.1 hypothetical protein [Lachnospiraceae bacterium]